jgi:peptide/nickel transport system permease protein
MYFFVGWLVLVILAALFGPYFLSDEALKQSLVQRLLPPSFDHPLGTDAVGRDILTRVIAGSQPTLAIAVGGVLVGLAIGMIAGTLAGYFGGIVNRVVMALVDIKLAFPTIIFAIGIIAVFGTSTPILIMVIGLTGWVTFARVQRAVVLKLKAQPFVEAAGSIGASHLRIIALHIVPNSLSPMLVMTSLDLVRIILLEASLSFLGLGVQPPTPSWGGMINAGRDYIQTAWWIALAPGAAIMLTALSVSRVGDWLRDVLDPDLG